MIKTTLTKFTDRIKIYNSNSTTKINVQLEIKESNISNAGLGVFAVDIIPKDFSIIYKGSLLKDINNRSCEYMWRIHKSIYYIKDDTLFCTTTDEIIGYRDANKVEHWTKYVNCSSSEENANISTQYLDNNVIYITKRDIVKGEELYVWYGQKYYDYLIEEN